MSSNSLHHRVRASSLLQRPPRGRHTTLPCAPPFGKFWIRPCSSLVYHPVLSQLSSFMFLVIMFHVFNLWKHCGKLKFLLIRNLDFYKKNLVFKGLLTTTGICYSKTYVDKFINFATMKVHTEFGVIHTDWAV